MNLNNPAAAARRAAKTLHEALARLQSQMIKLNAAALDEARLQNLLAFQQQVIERASAALLLSPLEQSDREDEVGDWLDDLGLDNGWEMASTFVTAGLELNELEEFIQTVPTRYVGDLLLWLCESLVVAGLVSEVEESSNRISELVGAVKAYTYMDQAPLQDVDLHQGLENTLKMLSHKLKNMSLSREYDPTLPVIVARGGELNQVWTNLIDNAIDATEGQGEIRLITRCESNFAMVEITDNGPGISKEARPHLFEPFFTTKDVGRGTGLGLDISYRIIRQHNGTIEVQSKPGETRFIVRLPVG